MKKKTANEEVQVCDAEPKRKTVNTGRRLNYRIKNRIKNTLKNRNCIDTDTNILYYVDSTMIQQYNKEISIWVHL